MRKESFGRIISVSLINIFIAIGGGHNPFVYVCKN